MTILGQSYSCVCPYYLANNDRFEDNLFIDNVTQINQSISICGVGAHRQNDRAENLIRNLRDSSRKLLLHAISRWSKAIKVNLWLCSLRHASNVSNMIPDNIGSSSKLERFAQINLSNSMKTFHTLGCPVYTLHNDFQNDNGTWLSKWEPRAGLGISLGLSLRHTRSVC